MYSILTEFEKIIFHITDKQMETIEFLSLGYSHKKVAKCMEISHRTVEVHVSNMTRKFHMSIFDLISLYQCSQCGILKKHIALSNMLNSDAKLLKTMKGDHKSCTGLIGY